MQILVPFILLQGFSMYMTKELHDVHSSPSIIKVIKSRRMIWAWHVARMGEKRNAYRILVGMPEGKRPLGRPRPAGKRILAVQLVAIPTIKKVVFLIIAL
jgi:hypothetical protein